MSKHARVRLGDLVAQVERAEAVDASQLYRMLGVRWYGEGLFVREELYGHQIAASKVYKVRRGDFVYNRLFAWKGSFAVAGANFDGCSVSNEFPCFEVNSARLDVRYLLLWFKRDASWTSALGLSSGATPTSRNRLKESAFLSLVIPLPPLPEQQRIVARIDDIAGNIAAASSLSNASQSAGESVLYAALRRGRLRLLESPYEQAQVGTTFRVTAGGTPSRDNPTFWNGTIPWIKTGELGDGDIEGAEERITQAGVDGSSAKLFPVDTVLVALYGQGQTRGRTGRLRVPATTNQACCAILPAPQMAEARYVQYWLRSWYHELREQSQGGAQPNWNAALIKALPIVLPPLFEQRRTVAEFDALHTEISRLHAAQKKARAKLDSLLPAVLDRAFAGAL